MGPLWHQWLPVSGGDGATNVRHLGGDGLADGNEATVGRRRDQRRCRRPFGMIPAHGRSGRGPLSRCSARVLCRGSWAEGRGSRPHTCPMPPISAP